MITSHSNVKRVSDEQVIEAYRAVGSVWKAADVLGICGQNIHRRLARLGVSTKMNRFSAEDDARLVREYEAHADRGELNKLASDMERTKYFIARQARRLGLTKRNRSRPYTSESLSQRVTLWHKTHKHPRGMLGKKHSEESRRRMCEVSLRITNTEEFKNKASDRMIARWHSMDPMARIQLQSLSGRTWKAGWRTIGGQKRYFRSRWEANYARYLEWLRSYGEILSWEHEPKTFWFNEIKRGVRSYLPDFLVIERNGKQAYHEVKGWMDAASATKIKRMAKYYPDVTLIVIDAPAYKSIDRKVRGLVPEWEVA